MDMAQFWTIVDAARQAGRGKQERMLEALQRELGKLSPEEIVAFKARMEELMSRAYTWDLWGAAYLMQGGCSDDMFEYFRAWLITQGRETFEAAVKDPETLAGAKLTLLLEGEEPSFEEFLYAPFDAYEEKTGEEMEMPPVDGPVTGDEPAGERWEESGDDLERRFPKLAAKFG